MQRLRISCHYHAVALALLVFSLVGVSACRSESTQRMAPEAVKGVLDLSDWDFKQDGPVKLKGEWAFYWQQHLGPDELSKSTAPFMRVPDFWHNYNREGFEFTGEGFATFHLSVLLNGKKESLALRVMEISTAYTLFVNGRELASAGVPGHNRDTTTPKQYRQIVDFENEADQLEII